MDFQDFEKILDDCLEMCDTLNCKPYFTITGGDPILHPNFWDILQLLNDNNLDYSILGNPFHLNDEVCERLAELNCRQYQLSLDGMRETHDYFRKPGSFDTTLEKIPVLKRNNVKASIMTTVSKRNINEITSIIDTVVEHKVDLFSFSRYCPTSLDKTGQMTSEEYHQLLGDVWVKFKEYKDSSTFFNLKDHLWTLFLYEKGLFKIPEGLDEETIYDGCNCGNNHLTILPSGDVFACRRMESEIGNALNEDILNIFTGDKLDKYREYEKFEKCNKCELLRFCRGCPAVSYGYTHNFYSPDPQCWKKIPK